MINAVVAITRTKPGRARVSSVEWEAILGVLVWTRVSTVKSERFSQTMVRPPVTNVKAATTRTRQGRALVARAKRESTPEALAWTRAPTANPEHTLHLQ